LRYAAGSGSVELVRALVAMGADVNTTDDYGRNCADVAHINQQTKSFFAFLTPTGIRAPRTRTLILLILILLILIVILILILILEDGAAALQPQARGAPAALCPGRQGQERWLVVVSNVNHNNTNTSYSNVFMY